MGGVAYACMTTLKLWILVVASALCVACNSSGYSTPESELDAVYDPQEPMHHL